MLPWKTNRTEGVDLAREHAKIRDRGSWSQNGGRHWNVPPFLPPRRCGRPIVLFVLFALVVGCASAQVVYQRVSAAKLTKAENAIRAMAVEEGWSDERLGILLANLHRKYREE
jgi:hypothetical protein